MPHNLFNTLQSFSSGAGKTGQLYSLPQLEKEGVGQVSRLPVSIRIVLESVLRNFDGTKITEDDVRAVANWKPNAERTEEVPFRVAHVLLQGCPGVPLLVDLAAMRSAVVRLNKNPGVIEPLVPVDLVIDHSVQVDFSSSSDAFRKNMEMEFRRNNSRYQFLKWGMQAFDGFGVIPPGIGICHQVNLEYLGKCVWSKHDLYYPDSLVGTDSHTTMIKGRGSVGWGVGGIEAEAAMLGQPVYMLTPDVVGVHMSGKLREGVTATDLVLAVTEMLRQAKVVGKFVEFHGEGAASLAVTDRATISNMSPEYGATMGYFPPDEETCLYLKATGRKDEHIDAVRNYFKAQGIFGIPRQGECDYSTVLELDLETIVPSVAGPKRPQDRIALPDLERKFRELLEMDVKSGGYGKELSEIDHRFKTTLDTCNGDGQGRAGGGLQKSETAPMVGLAAAALNTSAWSETEMMNNRPTPDRVEPSEPSPEVEVELGHGDVLIAAITSCTNTSNPSVMLAAGLLAKKAVERGLQIRPSVKRSLAPGSRVVTEYLAKTGLQTYLDQLGFNLVGYGCTTCIGNSGPLDPCIEKVLSEHDLIAASVLSGNRNFEARVHQSIKANFLMSPPLVVAFALAGRIDRDLSKEALGKDKDGQDVFLRDVWPSMEEIGALMREAFDAETYRQLYGNFAEQNPMWNEIPTSTGLVYEWDAESTYIQEPPFFEGFGAEVGEMEDIHDARPLAIFGDSVTTDHISPAGAIKATSPAGIYLQERGVAIGDFNSYGSRRGNHQVMMRGTFANVRIKNLMVPGVEGGVTIYRPNPLAQPERAEPERMSIYDAAMKYPSASTP